MNATTPIDPMITKRLSRAVLSNNMPLAVAALEAGANPNSLTGGDPFDPLVKILGRLEFTIMEQAIVRMNAEMVVLLARAGGWVTPKTMTWVGDEYVKSCSDPTRIIRDAAVAISKDPAVLQEAAAKWAPLVEAMNQAGAQWNVSVAAALEDQAYMHSPKELFEHNPYFKSTKP